MHGKKSDVHGEDFGIFIHSIKLLSTDHERSHGTRTKTNLLLTLNVRFGIGRKFPNMLGDALITRIQFPRLELVTRETLAKKLYI